MAGVGTLEPFDLLTPEKAYRDRFVDKDRKKAAFLTLAGAPLYELLVSLASPRQVSDWELTEVYVLTWHLAPRQSKIAAFYHLNKRDQHPDESVGNYMATFRSLAVGCNFGQMLDRMLRDRFVCGMRDEGLQRSLLADPELTVQQAMERAVTSEAAAASALSIRGDNIRRLESSSTESIHGISSIVRAVGVGTSVRSVRFAMPLAIPVVELATYVGPSHGRVHQIVPVVSPNKSVAVVINGRSCQFEVDSGSPVTIMKESSYRSGQTVIPISSIISHWSSRPAPDLLGCNWFEPLGIRLEGIHGVQCGNGIAEILKKFDHLFSSELGRYTGPPVALKVDQEVPPVRLPTRRIPYALLKPYEEELVRLCAQGILEPVEYSGWAIRQFP
ncbi:uncharacterized protein [Drosophila bipectinata]|uniref:uncharacterized protein n=1 Tax=Drosophila bipectinata TaxID=42026 RepID=UPI0038B38BEE